MNERQIISVEDVRSLALAIFDRLSASGIETVTIDQPSYWSVFPSDAFRSKTQGQSCRMYMTISKICEPKPKLPIYRFRSAYLGMPCITLPEFARRWQRLR